MTLFQLEEWLIQPDIYCINLYMLLVVLKVPVVYPSLDGNYNVLNTFQGLKDAIHTEIVWWKNALIDSTPVVTSWFEKNDSMVFQDTPRNLVGKPVVA